MLLLIDIGNTNTTIGFCDDKKMEDILRLKTVEDRSKDEYFYLLQGFISSHRLKRPEGAVISSVVPCATPVITDVMKEGFNIEPINVNHKIKTGLKFSIKNPEMLGADRIANAVAAHKLYKGYVIVVDFGTATTFGVITADGEYKGGAIMPGLDMSAGVLAEKTAKLPLIKLTPLNKTIGEDTASNILTGIILGHAGAVERIISEMVKKIKEKVTVVATGGRADLIVPYVDSVNVVNPLLTLEGLRLIYELNC